MSANKGGPTLRSPVPVGVVKPCSECGSPVPMKIHRDFLRKKYCSRECRSRHIGRIENRFLSMRKISCERCGEAFAAMHTSMRYCSRACQGASATMRWSIARATLEGHIRRLLRKSGKRDRKDLTFDGLMRLYYSQGGVCALSGVKMTWDVGKGHIATNISIDRIDSAAPYSQGNIQLVCRIINVMKHNLSVAELRHWCRIVSENAPCHRDQKASSA